MQAGRIHLDASMVELSVHSGSKEMASYMLLKKPFFKAVSVQMTIRFVHTLVFYISAHPTYVVVFPSHHVSCATHD